MKTLRSLAAAGLALVLASTALHAQGNVQATNGGYQNGTNGAKADPQGNAYVNEASKDRDNWIVRFSCIDDTLSVGTGTAWAGNAAANTAAGFTAESTAVFPAGAYRRFALQIWVKFGQGDTTTAVRLAVQIRGHSAASADSGSTTPWYGWTTVTGDVDSTGTGVTSAVNSPLILAWSGERVLDFSPKRGFAGLAPTPVAGEAFAFPNGMLLDLVDSRGAYFWAPFISVRVRCIGGPTTAAKAPRVTMNLIEGS